MRLCNQNNRFIIVRAIKQIAKSGRKVLFVATKKQAKDAIDKGIPFVISIVNNDKEISINMIPKEKDGRITLSNFKSTKQAVFPKS